MIKISSSRDWGLTGYFFYGAGSQGSARVRVGLKLRLKPGAAAVPRELNVLLHLANTMTRTYTDILKANTSSYIRVICRDPVNRGVWLAQQERLLFG